MRSIRFFTVILLVFGFCCSAIAGGDEQLKRGKEILKKLEALTLKERKGFDIAAFRGEVVTFLGGTAPPGATNDLMLAGGFYLRVVTPANKDLRPPAAMWEVEVRGKILQVLAENKIIVLEVEEKDWKVRQLF